VGTIAVLVSCRGDADSVLSRVREVLDAVLAHSAPPWPPAEEWARLLPGWFVQNCAPPRTREEAEQWLNRWRSLPPEDQAGAILKERWALADWLHWLEPSERQWFWWDAVVRDAEALKVMVEVSAWPAPLGALEWLLRASGAAEVSLPTLQ